MRDVEIIAKLNKLAKPVNEHADLITQIFQAIQGLANVLNDQRELTRISVARIAFIFQKLQLNEEEYAEYEKEIRAKFDSSKEVPEQLPVQSEGAGTYGSDSRVGDGVILPAESGGVHDGSTISPESGADATQSPNGCQVSDACELKG
jgi:hypothetical protein